MSLKKSKIPGVGLIPTHWVESKWRYVTTVLTDYTANGSFGDLAKNVTYLNEPDYARLIRLTDLRTNLANEGLYVNKHSYDYLSKSALYGGEFLIANVGANAGLVVEMPKIDYKATLGPNMMLARFDSNKVSSKYMLYTANSEYIQTQLLLRATASSAQPKLNKEDFRSIQFLLPPMDEQKRVVKYLEGKLPDVDAIIEKLKTKINLLEQQRQSIITEAVTKGLNPNVKMKDSGVEWIGEIPEHWNVRKIKEIANVHSSNVDKKSVEGEKAVLLCNYVDVYYNDSITVDMDFMKATAKDEQIETFTLKKHDVIITKDSESPTDIAIPTWVSQNLEGVVCGYHLSLIRCFENTLGHYLYYNLESVQIREQFYSRANGVTRYGLSKEAIKNGLIAVPPYNEQIQIAEKLYAVNKEIRNMTEKIKKQIEKLKKYRQSLIYEAVTGKIDVRDMELD